MGPLTTCMGAECVRGAPTRIRRTQRLKIPIYARNGIAEAWVVNLAGRCVHVFRDPAANGNRTACTVSGGASVSPQALRDIVIALTTLFRTAA